MPIVNLNLTVVVNKRNYDSVSLRTGCLDGRTRGRERTVSSDSGNDLGSLSLSLFLPPPLKFPSKCRFARRPRRGGGMHT